MDSSKFELKNLRYKAKSKFSKAKEMFFPNDEALQQSTPEAVAVYRAHRLTGDTILDIGCGVGSDSIALSQFCKKVIAVDSNERVLESAKQNAKVYGRENIEFVCADFEELDLKKLNVSAVFSDPSRRVQGNRVKNLNETLPNTVELVEWIQGQKIQDFAIEVSRDLTASKIPWACEKEWIALDCGDSEHELNCLTLYFGKFKTCERSLVVVPEVLSLKSNEYELTVPKQSAVQTYLYEVNSGIDRANLYSELRIQFPSACFFQPKFLTSSEILSSPFFRNRFRVLGKAETEADLISKLTELNAQKIVLRGPIPEQEYSAIKSRIESRLFGTQKLHVFFTKPFLICKNLDFNT